MEQDNENSNKLIQEDDLQSEDMDFEQDYDLDDESYDETNNEEHEINPSHIFKEKEENAFYLLKEGNYQTITYELVKELYKLLSDEEKQ